MQPTTVHDEVREYYGSILAGSDDLKTNAACCATEAPPRYVLDVMPLIADEVIERFYGCGSPIPPALEGCTVLDLGCGTGRDAFVLSKLVGESGHVIGVDMTPSQLEVAERNRAFHAERFGFARSNVEFRLGYIEDLASIGIADGSVDLVVSNCVVNLSPFKERVLSEVHRVLKPGGELYFSDIFADRRIPDVLRRDPVLVGECLGGALYSGDFQELMARCGWADFSCVASDPIHVGDLLLATKLGFTRFESRTIRAIKAEGLDAREEDFGQTATYLGTIPETPRYFDFDLDQRFIRGRAYAIGSNTARMLAQSRYGAHFDISDAKPHRGAFSREAAQRALDVRTGRRRLDARMLDEAYEKLGYVSFEERVGEKSLLTAHEKPTTMQANIIYACNLTCRHCFLECTPKSSERMDRPTMEACLEAFRAGGFRTMDITGGSSEMHPDFEWFLRESARCVAEANAREVGAEAHGREAGAAESGAQDAASDQQAPGEVIVRTNLTHYANGRNAHLLDAYAETGARIVASVPFFTGAESDSQRGAGVFRRAMEAVRLLNERGYARDGRLKLDLVYNVAGPFLPWPQEMIEQAYRVHLERDEGVRFDNLLAFNNFALGRFGAELLETGTFDDYLSLLADNFNAMALPRLMCRGQVNVDWDGRLYDCEANHALDLPIQLEGRDATVHNLAERGRLPERRIRTNPICYSCAAGFGSSCGGSLI